MTKFEEEVMATAMMIPTSDGNEIKFKTSSALYDYLLLSNGEAELYLQQQALPVVPECVAEWIEYVKGKDNNVTALLTDFDNMPEDVDEWLFLQSNDDNINLILRAWLDGYTVEKPQLFFLKNKLTNSYLCQYPSDKSFYHIVVDDDGISKLVTKFTKQEIDSMQTGSYEQIEVAE